MPVSWEIYMNKDRLRCAAYSRSAFYVGIHFFFRSSIRRETGSTIYNKFVANVFLPEKRTNARSFNEQN